MSRHTLDGQNPAPRKTPSNDDWPVNTNKQWLPLASKWCRNPCIHSSFNGGLNPRVDI